MNQWNQPDVPHKGWSCVAVHDNETAEHKCEMCGQEDIRYEHEMEHIEYPQRLIVGCVCAEKMENDYVNPRQRETKLKNEIKRKQNFMKQTWRKTPKARILRYKGKEIAIVSNKFYKKNYGIICGNKIYWTYNDKPILAKTVRDIAFEIFEKEYYLEKTKTNR